MSEVIGIIGAMDEEVIKLKDCLTDVTIKNIASMEFFEGKLSDKDVVVVRSGIGKVNAAICAQILADIYHVDAIINTGIAIINQPRALITFFILCHIESFVPVP